MTNMQYKKLRYQSESLILPVMIALGGLILFCIVMWDAVKHSVGGLVVVLICITLLAILVTSIYASKKSGDAKRLRSRIVSQGRKYYGRITAVNVRTKWDRDDNTKTETATLTAEYTDAFGNRITTTSKPLMDVPRYLTGKRCVIYKLEEYTLIDEAEGYEYTAWKRNLMGILITTAIITAGVILGK